MMMLTQRLSSEKYNISVVQNMFTLKPHYPKKCANMRSSRFLAKPYDNEAFCRKLRTNQPTFDANFVTGSK